jgi:hypothetical protein
MDCVDELRDWVLNSLIVMGVLHIHYKTSDNQSSWHPVGDTNVDIGQLAVSSLSIDDWVHDCSAMRKKDIAFMGHHYRMPMRMLERGVESGYFKEGAAGIIHPTSKQDLDSERVSAIGKGNDTDDDEIEPHFDAMDLYTPGDRMIRTYVVQDVRRMTLQAKAFAEYEWKGLASGPYHLLRLQAVPNNIVPKSTMADLDPLDRFINNMGRKVSRQVMGQKTVGLYSAGDETTAKNIVSAYDQEWINANDVQGTKLLSLPGADPGTVNVMGNMINQYDELAGNLKSLLGLAPQATTLGQEQIIQRAGTRMGNALQDRVLNEAQHVVMNISKLMWQDEFLTLRNNIVMDATGSNPILAEANWTPGDREGEFEFYKFSIVQYSMVLRTPGEKANMILDLVNRVYLPLQQQLAAQGGSIDMFELTTMLSEELHLSRLQRIIKFPQELNMVDVMGQLDGSGAGSKTERVYRRVSEANPAAATQWQQAPTQQPIANGVMG